MEITKENFIKDFIELSIEQGEAYDAIITDKWKETRKLNDQLSKELIKYSEFLAKDSDFAKDTMDKLIKENNFYVIMNTAGLLWDFNYKMNTCYKLFEKVCSNKEKKHQPTVIAANMLFLSIKDGSLKRRKGFPKLD